MCVSEICSFLPLWSGISFVEFSQSEKSDFALCWQVKGSPTLIPTGKQWITIFLLFLFILLTHLLHGANISLCFMLFTDSWEENKKKKKKNTPAGNESPGQRSPEWTLVTFIRQYLTSLCELASHKRANTIIRNRIDKYFSYQSV